MKVKRETYSTSTSHGSVTEWLHPAALGPSHMFRWLHRGLVHNPKLHGHHLYAGMSYFTLFILSSFEWATIIRCELNSTLSKALFYIDFMHPVVLHHHCAGATLLFLTKSASKGRDRLCKWSDLKQANLAVEGIHSTGGRLWLKRCLCSIFICVKVFNDDWSCVFCVIGSDLRFCFIFTSKNFRAELPK